MGFFNNKKKKQDKVYSMAEALKILSNPKFNNYTSVEVESGMYRIVSVEESRNLEARLRLGQSTKNEFTTRIAGEGAYRNINNVPRTTPKYNNYQSAKRYRENANYR